MSEVGARELHDRVHEAVHLLIVAQRHPAEQVRAALDHLREAVQSVYKNWTTLQPTLEPLVTLTQDAYEIPPSDSDEYSRLSDDERQMVQRRREKVISELTHALNKSEPLGAAWWAAVERANELSERALRELNAWEIEEERMIADEPLPPSWWSGRGLGEHPGQQRGA
jgi:hypothetical protein